MSIYRIQGNTITYPTNLYENYTLYLIKKYKNTSNTLQDNKTNLTENELKQVLHGLNVKIKELKGFISKFESEDNEHMFFVMEWEENLKKHYEIVKPFYKHFNIKLLSLEIYQRIEKLNKLKDI